MTISAKSIRFDENTMWVELNDARILGVPLVWFPKLLHATQSELENYELSVEAFIGIVLMKISLSVVYLRDVEMSHINHKKLLKFNLKIGK